MGVAFLILHMARIFLCFLFAIAFSCATSQNTIGLQSYKPSLSFDGYNLLYPHNQSSVFLFDNCGRIVHEWDDDDNIVPGNSAYITDEGNLIKCKRRQTSAVNDPIWAGGGGETIEVRSWENEVLARFDLNDSLMRLHHDVAPMPNGNILMIAWENKTFDEAEQAGRDTSLLEQAKLWPEAIIEWNPSLDSIVWTWYAWDHLIQDRFPDKENFGVVADHPELIDINYDERDGHPDWLHMNSIDYNPILDQIVLSVPNFNELWIIDHSTTKEESAGHSGGRANKGGDLLYRWGNSQAYNKGNDDDKQLFFQHDVNWIDPFAEPGDERYGDLVLYNNRVTVSLSTVDIIKTPVSEDGNSYMMNDGFFLPETYDQRVSHPNNEIRSNSTSLSSAQVLDNGNFLICAGRWGFTYELTPQNEVAWEYITPFKFGVRAMQGDTTFTISNNITFRLKRYSGQFKGFEGRDLSPKDYIEMNPDTSYCNFLITPTQDLPKYSFSIFPNPTEDHLILNREIEEDTILEIFDVSGQRIDRKTVSGLSFKLDVSHISEGVHFIRLDGVVISFVKI